MSSVVVDTGPLVLLLNRRERHHAWAVQTMDVIELRQVVPTLMPR